MSNYLLSVVRMLYLLSQQNLKCVMTIQHREAAFYDTKEGSWKDLEDFKKIKNGKIFIWLPPPIVQVHSCPCSPGELAALRTGLSALPEQRS